MIFEAILLVQLCICTTLHATAPITAPKPYPPSYSAAKDRSGSDKKKIAAVIAGGTGLAALMLYTPTRAKINTVYAQARWYLTQKRPTSPNLQPTPQSTPPTQNGTDVPSKPLDGSPDQDAKENSSSLLHPNAIGAIIQTLNSSYSPRKVLLKDGRRAITTTIPRISSTQQCLEVNTYYDDSEIIDMATSESVPLTNIKEVLEAPIALFTAGQQVIYQGREAIIWDIDNSQVAIQFSNSDPLIATSIYDIQIQLTPQKDSPLKGPMPINQLIDRVERDTKLDKSTIAKIRSLSRSGFCAKLLLKDGRSAVTVPDPENSKLDQDQEHINVYIYHKAGNSAAQKTIALAQIQEAGLDTPIPPLKKGQLIMYKGSKVIVEFIKDGFVAIQTPDGLVTTPVYNPHIELLTSK